jgi:hypothetical protein
MGMTEVTDLAPNHSFVPFLKQRVTIILLPYQLRQSVHVLLLLHVNVMGIRLGRTFVNLFGHKNATVWVTRAYYIIIVLRP